MRCLLCLLLLSPAIALTIDGDQPANLPPGIDLVPGDEGHALRFSTVGITVPTAGNLTAAAGTVKLRLQMPADWPVDDDRVPFHLEQTSHQHVTLLFRGGGLMAVYKGGEPYFASINSPLTRRWEPLSWHEIWFTWQATGEEVDFLLALDGEVVGTAGGHLLPVWPETCTVGSRGERTPWQGLMDDIELSPVQKMPAALSPGERTITVHGGQTVGESYPFWTVGNYNKPSDFLKPDYWKNSRFGRPFTTQANMVYLLGGRYTDLNVWYLGLGPDGEPKTDFSGMIAQLKTCLDAGITPWPVLDNVPYPMSDPPQEHTYGNTAPAADVNVWAKYVVLAIRAMVDAFGADTVSKWWFRLGTEPDLNPGHWCGTKEQYLEHYDRTVEAVRKVLPNAIVGPGNILNPAGGQFGERSVGNWGLDIIDHCGRAGTPMDWFSFSWYGRVGQPLSVFDDAVNAVHERLVKYPKLAQTPVLVGEFAVLHDDRGRRLWGGDTTEWAASFYAALARRVYDHGVREVYEWSQTTGGIPHARALVMAMLASMSDGERLAVEVAGDSAADCGAIAVRKGDDLHLLLYNHRPLRKPKVPETVSVVVEDARFRAGETWRLSEQLVDAEHGVWSYAFEEDCREAGVEPAPKAGSYEGAISLSHGDAGLAVFGKHKAKYAELAKAAVLADGQPLPVQDGTVVLERELAGHSVRHLTLSPSDG